MNLKQQLELKLQKIGDILTKEYQNEPDIGGLSGLGGIALFQFYYAKYLETESNADLGAEILTEIIDRINKGFTVPTYCNGIAGAGWVFEHLLEEKFIELNNDELLANFDDYLSKIMFSEMKQGNYDFLHAGIGYVFYFLKRYQNTKNKDLKGRYEKYIHKFILLLQQKAIPEEDGFKWESILDSKSNKKGYNLSLSHGMSSIVILLAKLYDDPAFKSLVEHLLRGAINYIIGNQLSEASSLCLYPSTVSHDSTAASRSRLAWCYGDLGIGLAFWHASNALKDMSLQQLALDILKHGTLRKDVKETGVIDPGVCHGSFGNAQIFNYIFKQTGDKIFKDAASFWMQNGLDMATHDDGYSGFKQWSGTKEIWNAELCLLTGIAGIGLVIIDYLSEHKLKWDECLMIS